MASSGAKRLPALRDVISGVALVSDASTLAEVATSAATLVDYERRALEIIIGTQVGFDVAMSFRMLC